MKTPSVTSIAAHLDHLLEISRYSDLGINGLQVESPVKEVRKIAFAVDAGSSIIEAAANANCQMLIVHHGIFWGGPVPIVGPLAHKLHLCMTRGLSLYASHLPLDGHIELGNAAQLAKLLKFTAIESAFNYKGAPAGVIAHSDQELSIQDIAANLARFEGALTPPLVLPFGTSHIKRIGIATGSATVFIPECAALGLDLLISGEPKQDAYHTAKDFGVNVICMGHYASETFGVRALERVLQNDFRVETCWISEPTGI